MAYYILFNNIGQVYKISDSEEDEQEVEGPDYEFKDESSL